MTRPHQICARDWWDGCTEQAIGSHDNSRLPASTADLESAFRRAEAAHVEHEKRAGRSHLFHRSNQDQNWPAWYASYAQQRPGTPMPGDDAVSFAGNCSFAE